ncbi:hypothetical protein BKA65DRAFT_479125 [Rhexocercosporidium sp. MPI-PUGE-AT-0058]|nr:hypothetical protein BKA65DRAFT_479125 [Rhexocercosporidium sp. MPI-PUGE-AT-0058]
MVADEQSEMFAIGTCIYALVMEHLPYPTMTEGEVATLFEMKAFPPTDNESFEPYGNLHTIVRGCWTGRYSSIRELDTEVGILFDELGVSMKSVSNQNANSSLNKLGNTSTSLHTGRKELHAELALNSLSAEKRIATNRRSFYKR